MQLTTHWPAEIDTDLGRLRLLMTASEAYPAFEEAVAAAESRIVAGFRIFDPDTHLRSAAGQAIGRDWFDLIVHTLRRGVSIDLLLSDFDPIVAAPIHRATWSSLRRLWAAAEIAGPDAAKLTIHHGRHPAEVGLLPRLILWPRVLAELRQVRRRLEAMPLEGRRTALRDMPGLAERLWLDDGGRVRLRHPWPPRLYPASHHQKLAVIDGKLLYIGGLDLDERRFDDHDHDRPGHETWHDIQVTAEGEIAEAAETYLRAVPDAVHGRAPLPPAPPALVTTVSRVRRLSLPYLSPQPLRQRIAAAIYDELSKSRGLIYLETQFFRDRRLARRLASAARHCPDLHLLMVLPAAPEDVAFEARRKLDARYGEFLQAHCIAKVRRAFGSRAFFASPAQPRRADHRSVSGRDILADAPLIYVHAKLCIFDSRTTIVSSANLNGRSLRWDTEAGLRIQDEAFTRHALGRALSHWRMPAEVVAQAAENPAGLIAGVREAAASDVRKVPDARRGLLLPYDSRPAERFGRPAPGIPEEMV
ncbi:phospholipase [Rhodobacteraceae bacterium CCMM004]|nr:phospholipase [Rhodobacteraceae bacterium CCMM004]